MVNVSFVATALHISLTGGPIGFVTFSLLFFHGQEACLATDSDATGAIPDFDAT